MLCSCFTHGSPQKNENWFGLEMKGLLKGVKVFRVMNGKAVLKGGGGGGTTLLEKQGGLLPAGLPGREKGTLLYCSSNLNATSMRRMYVDRGSLSTVL